MPRARPQFVHLCAELSITNTPRADHAQYIANWLEVLKTDKKAIFSAASLATTAVTYLFNLQPDARKMSTTRALMSAYLSYLYRCGEKRVYGQIVTFESRRGEKMFERYGFRVMNRAEITKYKAFYPESVYLSTVIKNLETAEPLTVSARTRP